MDVHSLLKSQQRYLTVAVTKLEVNFFCTLNLFNLVFFFFWTLLCHMIFLTPCLLGPKKVLAKQSNQV